MKRIIVRRSDCRRATFRCGGPGGQAQNKLETGVRFTHTPTGVSAESRSDRSQHANDIIAFKLLQAKLDEMWQDELRRAARLGYEAKPDAAFGARERSYFLDRDARIVDHKTGHVDRNARQVLRGKIDGFVRADLLHRMGA